MCCWVASANCEKRSASGSGSGRPHTGAGKMATGAQQVQGHSRVGDKGLKGIDLEVKREC